MPKSSAVGGSSGSVVSDEEGLEERSSIVIELLESSKRHSEPGLREIVRGAWVVVDCVAVAGAEVWDGSRPGRKSIWE